MSEVTIVLLIEAHKEKGKALQLFPCSASGFVMRHGKLTNVERFFIMISKFCVQLRMIHRTQIEPVFLSSFSPPLYLSGEKLTIVNCEIRDWLSVSVISETISDHVRMLIR